MNFQLEKPEAVIKAQKTRKGLNWFVEILVFIAVYILSTIGQLAIVLPGELLMLSRNEDYQAALAAGDEAGMTAALLQIGASDTYMILSLVSCIIIIVIVVLFCRLIQKRRLDSLGFIRGGAGREYLIGLLAGFILFSTAVLICVLTGALKFQGISDSFRMGTFLLFVVAFMIQGMSEEVLCRGYLMISVGRRYSMWTAVLINSLVFAALHLLNTGISILAFINLTLFGVFASVYFIKRGSIWGIGALHAVWNLVQGNVYGLHVSGMETECSIFKMTMAEGKSLLNGGTFGPEGGLAITIVLLAGTLFFSSNFQHFGKITKKKNNKREWESE